MTLKDRLSVDILIAAGLLVLAGLAILFMGSLVAAPKTLMGRSMTAIPPSMFPNITLSLLAILSAVFLLGRLRETPSHLSGGINTRGWQEATLFFAVLTFYALTMVPLGFYFSTAITMAILSWLVGNRSIPQIVILSVTAPVALYLAATRLLAVSLPELNFIELFYARVLG